MDDLQIPRFYDLGMPFDLEFEEPPVIGARATLPTGERKKLRLAIGAQSVERAASLPLVANEEMDEEGGDLIHLHESGLREDLKHDWMAAPVVDLLEAIVEVASIDLSDGAEVGGHLRRATYRLVSEAESVAELVQFLDLFKPSVVHELVRPACVSGLTLTKALMGWMTSETDQESDQLGNAFNTGVETLRRELVILCALPHNEKMLPGESPAFTAVEEMELLLGVDWPTDPPRWIDQIRHLEASGYDICELGGRQLRYFGPYHASDSLSSRTFLELGLRIGRSAYPLLAHRSAYLAWQLLEAATAVDETKTLAALHGLLHNESIWMIASQEDYFEAVERYRAGDKAAIIEAYSDLAEGTLRRYGSLVVALERIIAGEPIPSPLVWETIGEIEDQLGLWDTEPLPALILRFLERNLRNAEAHANVFVDAKGALRVRLRDGSVETLIPNHVYGRTAGLRSVLDGVDIAMNHARSRDHQKHPPDLTGPMPEMSATMFESTVQRFAEVNTRGLVSVVSRDENTLTLTYHGPPSTYEELKALADSLTRLLGPILPVIHILDEDGNPIHVFQPPKLRGVGRNDPCPCGSEKKYKRCHGA